MSGVSSTTTDPTFFLSLPSGALPTPLFQYPFSMDFYNGGIVSSTLIDSNSTDGSFFSEKIDLHDY
jgi:hypothetical protein